MFDATQHLVEEVGHSLVVELHLDHLAQVGVHQLHHQVPEESGVHLPVAGSTDDVEPVSTKCLVCLRFLYFFLHCFSLVPKDQPACAASCTEKAMHRFNYFHFLSAFKPFFSNFLLKSFKLNSIHDSYMSHVSRFSFIIQHENRRRPAASHYTCTTFTDFTPAVQFSQLLAKINNKPSQYAQCITLLYHQSDKMKTNSLSSPAR